MEREPFRIGGILVQIGTEPVQFRQHFSTLIGDSGILKDSTQKREGVSASSRRTINCHDLL